MFHSDAQAALAEVGETCSSRVTKEANAVPTSPHLVVEREGHLVTLTMNRPEARNAFGAEMLARFADAWDMIDGDPEVRVAILTGAGGHFCAGSDLKAMAGPRA